ncbi:hypothetical protein [Arthrobacter alpinus]|nr:hypothetical protein [Arthrobacter alpinus]
MTVNQHPQITIIVVDDHFHWAGLQPERIAEAAALHAATLTTATGSGK